MVCLWEGEKDHPTLPTQCCGSGVLGCVLNIRKALTKSMCLEEPDCKPWALRERNSGLFTQKRKGLGDTLGAGHQHLRHCHTVEAQKIGVLSAKVDYYFSVAITLVAKNQ